MKEIKFQMGQMVKEPRAMTKTEKAAWKLEVAQAARKYLFSIGQPLVYKNADGRVVAEYQDGHISIIR